LFNTTLNVYNFNISNIIAVSFIGEKKGVSK
jgi:hypothetical protein